MANTPNQEPPHERSVYILSSHPGLSEWWVVNGFLHAHCSNLSLQELDLSLPA